MIRLKVVGQMEKRNWQFAGPFENLSGSAFNNQYGPLESPDKRQHFME